MDDAVCRQGGERHGKERLEQFPKTMGPENVTPDCEECIRISTEASLREGLAPSALVILSPARRWAELWEERLRRSALRRAGLKRAAGDLYERGK